MKFLPTTFSLLFLLSTFAQSPDWSSIKSNVTFNIADPTAFGTPVLQSQHNLGWEDGLFMSRDGKHMYAFYAPADMISFSAFISEYPICPPIHPFIRGPLLDIDTVTNPWGCSSILHSDIIYASRPDTASPFGPWQSSNLARAAEWEGAPQVGQKPDGSVDFLIYSGSNEGQNDLFWIRDTSQNPVGPGTLLPYPVNEPDFPEDNPHLERINDSTLVLFLDNHAGAGTSADIFFTTSTDNGTSWTPKMPLTSINTSHEDVQPHFWSDGIDNWLYYVTNDTTDSGNRLSIFRARQLNPSDFNSWGEKEFVIGPGSVTGGAGHVAAVGEPSLTAWGDLSFVTVVMALGTSDTTDAFEIDPWFVPTLHPVSLNLNTIKTTESWSIYPNPANNYFQTNLTDNYTIQIFDITGKRWLHLINPSDSTISTEQIPSGFYTVLITQGNEQNTFPLVINH